MPKIWLALSGGLFWNFRPGWHGFIGLGQFFGITIFMTEFLNCTAFLVWSCFCRCWLPHTSRNIAGPIFIR